MKMRPVEILLRRALAKALDEAHEAQRKHLEALRKAELLIIKLREVRGEQPGDHKA
jgi:hypothetical protein